MEIPTSPIQFLATLYLFIALIITTTSAAATGTTTNEFIKTSCSITTYPSLCLTSLSNHASTIQTSPKLLAHAALSITLDTAKSTSTMMAKFFQTREMTPREAVAMKDCLVHLSDSVDQLKNSMGEMSQVVGFTRRSKDMGMLMSDMQTWVSAALTDYDTCMMGFEEVGIMNGSKVKNVVKGRIVIVAHMTSNALALINNYASSIYG